MGFMDNLKKKASSFSEETVHHVDWDEEARLKSEQEQEQEYVEYEEAPAPAPAPEPDSAKEGIKLSDFNLFGKISKNEKPAKQKTPREKPAKEPKVQKEKPSREKPSSSPHDDSDDDAPKSGILSWLKKDKEKQEHEDTPEHPTENSTVIKDILEFLDIQSSYNIPTNVLMVQDLDGVGEFDVQMPKGYDMGQVRTFVAQVEDSIKYFQEKLQERNEHVAKLATTVDRLQVDLHNSKFDAEIATGVNILPTEESEQLSSENLELKLKVRNLEQKIRELEHSSGEYIPAEVTEEDQARIDSLQDQLSIAQREHDEALDENRELRARIAYMEEELDDPQRMMQQQQNDAPVFHDVDDIQYEDSFAEGLEDHNSLPDLSGGQDQDTLYEDDTYYEDDVAYEDDGELPDFDFDEPDTAQYSSGLDEIPYRENQNFAYVDDEPLNEIVDAGDNWDNYDYDEEMPSLEPETREEAQFAALLDDDDEDDILEKMIRDRQGGSN